MKKLSRTKQLEKDYNIIIQRVNYNGYIMFKYDSNITNENQELFKSKITDFYILSFCDWLNNLDEVENDIKKNLNNILDFINNSYYNKNVKNESLEKFYKLYPTMKKRKCRGKMNKNENE